MILKRGLKFVLFLICLQLLEAPPSRAETTSEIKRISREAKQYTTSIQVTLYAGMNTDISGTHTGTGFIIDAKNGWILTNAHVSGQSPGDTTVTFSDGTETKAIRLFVDRFFDIAIIKVQPTSLPKEAGEAKLNCEAVPEQGTPVITYGNPTDYKFSATTGIVSDLAWFFPHSYIHTDATADHGSSGGPLIDAEDGRIVGIVTALGKQKDDAAILPSILATPIIHACKIIDLLQKHHDARYRRLPFDVAYDFKTHQPVVMSETSKSSPFKTGDVITKIDGIEINNIPDLVTSLRGTDTSTKVTVTRHLNPETNQNRELETVEANIETIPIESSLLDLAVGVSGVLFGKPWYIDVNAESHGSQIVVTDILESKVNFLGIDGGMILQSLDGIPFNDLDKFYEYLDTVEDERSLRFVLCVPDQGWNLLSRECRQVTTKKYDLKWFGADGQ